MVGRRQGSLAGQALAPGLSSSSIPRGSTALALTSQDTWQVGATLRATSSLIRRIYSPRRPFIRAWGLDRQADTWAQVIMDTMKWSLDLLAFASVGRDGSTSTSPWSAGTTWHFPLWIHPAHLRLTPSSALPSAQPPCRYSPASCWSRGAGPWGDLRLHPPMSTAGPACQEFLTRRRARRPPSALTRTTSPWPGTTHCAASARHQDASAGLRESPAVCSTCPKLRRQTAPPRAALQLLRAPRRPA